MLTKEEKQEIFESAVSYLSANDNLVEFSSNVDYSNAEVAEFLAEYEVRVNATTQSVAHLIEQAKNRIDPDTKYHIVATVTVYEGPGTFDRSDIDSYVELENNFVYLNRRDSAGEARDRLARITSLLSSHTDIE